MRTRIEGHTKDTICITTNGEQDIIECKDCHMKLWLSAGTILMMEYDTTAGVNIWRVRIIYGPVDKNYVYRQNLYQESGFFAFDDCCTSEVFETEEEVVMFQRLDRW